MKYEFNRTLEIVDTKLFVKVEFEFGVEYQAKEGGRRVELCPHITSDSLLRSLLYTSFATGGGARFSDLQS